MSDLPSIDENRDEHYTIARLGARVDLESVLVRTFVALFGVDGWLFLGRARMARWPQALGLTSVALMTQLGLEVVYESGC